MSAKLVYGVTMSLDGFIAGPGGDMGWLTPHIRPNPAVPEFIAEVGALLVGHRTFLGDDRVVNVLGAQTARACLDAGRLDELLVFIAPVLLGDGTRLFDRPGGADVRLERLVVDTRAELATMIRWRVL